MIKRVLKKVLKPIQRNLAWSLRTKRQKLFICFFAFILFFLSLYLVYWFFYGSRSISTNNAYVGAEVSEVHTLVEGLVKDIYVTDTQAVKKGELLVLLDDQETIINLKQSEASFLKAQADLERTQLNYKRRESLAHASVVSAEDLSDSENAVKIAEAKLQEATAIRDLAALNDTRTKIYAPIEGVIVQRHVQLGQRVIPGNALLSIVPLYNSYVNANFKENQLRSIKPGQAVTLTSDKYGSSVIFQGIVQGFSAGTGSYFAIIPAQNATGNWIKVVQRLPVRIVLKSEELRKMPLEVGLSMHAKIDISGKAYP